MSAQIHAAAGVTAPEDVRILAPLSDDATFPFTLQFSDPESVDHVQVGMTRDAASALLVKLANALGREGYADAPF